MIFPLRQRHHQTVIALGAFLPVVFIVGITLRKPMPTPGELPAALEEPARPGEDIGAPLKDLFAKMPLQVQVVQETQSPRRFAVELSGERNLVKPDLIVYWAAGNPAVGQMVPDTAILLGAFQDKFLPLPPQAARSPGVLLLYSLADGEMVDVSKPFSLPFSEDSAH